MAATTASASAENELGIVDTILMAVGANSPNQQTQLRKILDILRTQLIDLIILDLLLKDASDFKFIAGIDKYNQDILKGIYPEDEIHCLQKITLGIGDNLVKGDVTPQLLRQILEHTIAQQRQTESPVISPSQSHQLSQSKRRWNCLSKITFAGIILNNRDLILDTLTGLIPDNVTNLINKYTQTKNTIKLQNLMIKNIVPVSEKDTGSTVVIKDSSTFPVELPSQEVSYTVQEMQVVVRDITQQKPLKEALNIREDARRQQSQTLVQIARSQTFQAGNLNAALREITAAAAKTLSVHRLGVWLYNADHSAVNCINSYDITTGEHSFGGSLLKANYPNYFQALATKRNIAVHDAITDKRTQELSQSYLYGWDVAALLSVPIWLQGKLVGVLFHEHLGETRHWTLEEESFAGAIAEFITLAIEASETVTTHQQHHNTVQEAWYQSQAQLRAIFDRAPIGIGLTDIQGQIVDINPALCQMLGYRQEEMRGKYLTDYASPEQEHLEFYAQHFTEQHCVGRESLFLRQDGELVWTQVSVSIIPDSNGKPEFFLTMIEDISDRKQTELKLRASQAAAEAGSRAKSEFLATMSHELRTPLNAIMGLSQLLQQEMVGALNDKQREYISCVYSSGEHLLALINDILDLSKVEAGKEELLLLPLLVSELCQNVISTVRDQALVKGLELTSEIDPEADICVADARRVKQMLLNLLTNAIKFTPAGQISLEVKKITGGITFTVTDTGIGIDSSQFQFLFEPFKQLDSQLNRQYEGTGLGLALTQKLARLHGGDVTVESTLGVGSRFTLFLPHQPD